MRQEVKRMLMVDLYVPELDKTFDFELAEDVAVGELIGKLQALFEKSENSKLQSQNYELYDVQKGMLLQRNATAREQELQSGEQLVWV